MRPTRKTLVVSGYIREHNNNYNNNIPKNISHNIIDTIILFYHISYTIYAKGENFSSEWGIGNKNHSNLINQQWIGYINLKTFSLLMDKQSPKDIYIGHGRFYIKFGKSVYGSGKIYGKKSYINENQFKEIIFPNLNIDNDYIEIISNGIYSDELTYFVSKNNIFYRTQNSGVVEVPSMTSVFATDRVIKIECSKIHSIFLTALGHIYTCGVNEKSICGLPNDNDDNDIISEPININKIMNLSSSVKFRDISCGSGHNLCLSYGNQLYVFGSNEYGQCGLHLSTPSTPIILFKYFVDRNISIYDISSGGWHNFIISRSVNNNNRCYGWGRNKFGQLGIGNDKSNINIPIQLSINNRIIIDNIYCGLVHTVILTKKNELFTFGYNASNEVSIFQKWIRIINKPYHLTRHEIGINPNTRIECAIPTYKSTIIVVEE